MTNVEKAVNVKQSATKETQIIGSIGFDVYRAYFASVESRFLIFCVLAVLVVEQVTTSFIDLFVSKW